MTDITPVTGHNLNRIFITAYKKVIGLENLLMVVLNHLS